MVGFNDVSDFAFNLDSGTQMTVGIDWLSFTFKMPDSDYFNDKYFSQESAFKAYCPELSFIFDDAFEFRKNSSHYRFAYGFHENCAYFHDGLDVNKGFNVSVPGHALEWFFKSCNMSVLELFEYFGKHYIAVSRIDIAVDDYNKTYRPDFYADLMVKGKLKTRMKFWSYLGSERHTGGRSFALGKRSAPSYLRIYDKDKESDGEYDCVRYEFELHRHKADKFISEMRNLKLSDCVYNLFVSFFVVLANPIESFNGYRLKDSDRDSDYNVWLKSQVSRIANVVLQCNIYTKKERAYSEIQHTWNHIRHVALDVYCGFMSFEEAVLQLKNFVPDAHDLRYIEKYCIRPEIQDFVDSPYESFNAVFTQSNIRDFIPV